MVKIKKFLFWLIIGLCLFVLFSITIMGTNNNNDAYAEVQCQTESESAGNSEVTPRLLTSISLSIKGGNNGKIYATAKNEFTLFPSKVYVVLELYSSSTYTENINDMQLEGITTIDDLNIGEIVTLEVDTGGVQKYWCGKVSYRENDGNWKQKITAVVEYSANGNYLGAY